MKISRNERKTNGITLVTLVVTVIILLILAGITITELTGNGLFAKVQLAKETQENAQIDENTTLGSYEDKILEYIDGTRDNNNWSQIYKGNIESCTNQDFSPYSEIRICFLTKNTSYMYSEWNYYTVSMLENQPTDPRFAFKVTVLNHSSAYISVYIKKESNGKYSYAFIESTWFDVNTFDLLIEGR